MRNAIFSPLSPQREMKGSLAAFHYYALMDYSPKEIITSAQNLYQYLCNKAGYEFANGFLDAATYLSIKRASDKVHRNNQP